jgi:hypothetical protein
MPLCYVVRMVALYLYVNAALYLLFAAWTTLSPWVTATNIGYTSLSSGGRTEYLVVYGGMEIGFAAFFAWTAASAGLQRAGLVFALFLYVPIVLYRSVALWRFWPVPATTLATAGLEIVLLVWAVVLVVRTRAIFMS